MYGGNALLTKGCLIRMSGFPTAPAGTTALLAAALAVALLAAGAVPASAQVRITVDKPAPAAPPAGEKLTLENADPLPVPPPPRIATPRAVPAPRPFVAPVPMEPPAAPVIAEESPVNPPDVPRGAPAPAPAPSRPVPVLPPPSAAPPPAVAALPAEEPPAPAIPRPANLSVVFDGIDLTIPPSADETLAQVAQRLNASPAMRLQVLSYASGTPDTAREARQRSLTRAVALRERLSALGVRSMRVDIRALGNTAEDGPHDRIDLEFLNE